VLPLEQPAHFALVAAWHHQECERQGLTSSLALRQQRLRQHLGPQQLPKTLVALRGTKLLGCVSLVEYAYRDAGGHLGPKPCRPIWLSNLFVLEQWRGQGIGNLLIEAAKAYVAGLGADELWLSAAEHTAYYQKRAWQIIRTTRLGGRQVNVMRIDTNPMAGLARRHGASNT
jgi:GNAT superfamily N-acetyltransferase